MFFMLKSVEKIILIYYKFVINNQMGGVCLVFKTKKYVFFSMNITTP